MRFFLLRLSREDLERRKRVRVLKETSLRLPPSARTLPWETERREREGKKGKEHRRRRRLEDTKREMLIHGRRVSSSFVSYLDDPLTILLFCTASILSWILSFAEAQRRIKEKSAHVQLAYLHFRWIVCLRKLVYSGADPPLSLSLSLCRRSIPLWAGGLERNCVSSIASWLSKGENEALWSWHRYIGIRLLETILDRPLLSCETWIGTN